MFHGPNPRPRRNLHDDFFNWNLRNARVNSGYTVSRLAKEVGVSPASISFYERLATLPTHEIAGRIARTLGKERDYLFPEGLRVIAHDVKNERRNSLGYDARISSLDGINSDELAVKNNTEGIVDREELCESVKSVLHCLKYREREILKLKYGIDGGYCYDGEDISRIFKITKEMVRQIERKAIRKLRDVRRSEGLRVFLDVG